jgi:hypothetical protein
MALDLVAQPLHDMRDAGAIDSANCEEILARVSARIAAGTWLDAALMLRVTGEKP